MAEQAGICRVTMYEAKGLSITYNSETDIRVIANTGEVLTLENADEETQNITLESSHQRSVNNIFKYRYAINWQLLGLSDDNLDLISQLKSSIYGWVCLFEFYNLDKRILLEPFKFVDAGIDNNQSNHYNIELRNIIFGGTFFSYTPITDEVITADSDVVTADSTDVDASGGTI